MTKRVSTSAWVRWPTMVVLGIVGAPLHPFAAETAHAGGSFVGPPIPGSRWRPAKAQEAGERRYYRENGSHHVRSQFVLANLTAGRLADLRAALHQGQGQREHRYRLVPVLDDSAVAKRMILATTFPVGSDGRARNQVETTHLISLGGNVWQLGRDSQAVFLGSITRKAVDLSDLSEALRHVAPREPGATGVHDSPGRLLGVENRQYQVRYTLTHNNNLVQRKYAVDPTTGRLGAEPVRVVTIFKRNGPVFGRNGVVIEGLPNDGSKKQRRVLGSLDGTFSTPAGRPKVLVWKGRKPGQTLEQAVDGLFDTAP